jgi:hypothetical protein
MTFAFYESLDASEARSLLEGFLETEARGAEQMLAQARREGLCADFGITSLSPLMRWALDQIKTVPKLADTSLPNWITATDSYKRGLFDFSEDSKPMGPRIAFYMGECFVRGFPALAWSIGDGETALKNMPVVSGFRGGQEMPPLLVVKNLFRRVLSKDAKDDTIDRAVQRWVALAGPESRSPG